jgi:two-component system phosphate regulon sensor histidine kinase PhoR
LLTIHDIREEKQLEHMKLDFVSMAAHELRTPLTSIKGYLSVLGNEIKSKLTDEQNMFLGRVQASAEQLLALVEDILNVSGIERNKSQLHFEPTDLKGVAVQVIEELTAQASAKTITLALVPPEREISSVSADRLRVREVFINLISNAITYSNPGGKIAVSFEANTEGVTVHIADTGIGIPKEAIPHLFTKFFRVKDGLLQSTKGTGLGLYIIKSIIEQHQGKVWVESTVGKGSTFSFFIPFVHIDPKQVTTRVDAQVS